ncbi:MAG: YkgJ family cysteine cluster protein [Chloroflexi bacterium]|nr:YkgJ family cysteine cluster protein [Chloroflexota bacterium]
MPHTPPLLSDPDQVAARGLQLADEQWAWYGALLASNELADDRHKPLLDALVAEIMAQIDCRTCGRCCQRMGPVVDASELERLALTLDLSPHAFRQRYLRPMWPQASAAQQEWLLSDPCPLHDGLLCTVYEARPQICRDFPQHVGRNLTEQLATCIETARICPITFNVVERLRRQIAAP